jgi:hypothetical protein
MGWTIRGLNFFMDKKMSSSQHPDWLWGPSSLLFNGYLGFPGVRRLGHEAPSRDDVWNTWGMKLHLEKTLGIRGAVPPFPLCAFMKWTRATLHLSLPLFLGNYFATNSNKSCTFSSSELLLMYLSRNVEIWKGD